MTRNKPSFDSEYLLDDESLVVCVNNLNWIKDMCPANEQHFMMPVVRSNREANRARIMPSNHMTSQVDMERERYKTDIIQKDIGA